MTYDAYCFDLDGTLWDAIDGTVEAWNRIAQRYELRETRIRRADLEATTGRPIGECVSALFGDSLPISLEALIAEIEQEEACCISADNAEIYRGVPETLVVLSERTPLSIVSNCQPWYLERFFEISNLKEFFGAWDCHGRAGDAKSVMISRLARGSTLYVGDTISDQRAAQAAGVSFAYAAYGFGEVEHYDHYLPDFKSLLA